MQIIVLLLLLLSKLACRPSTSPAQRPRTQQADTGARREKGRAQAAGSPSKEGAPCVVRSAR